MTPSSEQKGLAFQEPSSFSPSASLPSLVAAHEPSDVRQSLARSDYISLPHTVPLSTDRNQSHDRSKSPASIPPHSALIHTDERRNIIIRSFAPRISVFASSDTQAFIRQKGFRGGLSDLLRPFGELVQGSVVIRDSIGGSRAWRDFGVRFFDPEGQGIQDKHFLTENDDHGFVINSSQRGALPADPQPIEQILSQCLDRQDFTKLDFRVSSETESSSLFQTYLRSLLSQELPTPYETFCHPVACLIAVSSRNEVPIEALRKLYAKTSATSPNVPPYMSMNYLRYYLLVHDEENDDIAKSTALFDLMKRHFGLHCHLLRLRSSQCVPSDDDSTLVPSCKWVSPREELAAIRSNSFTDDVHDDRRYVVESDATAVNAMIREMVTQSVIPFMESRVMTWNDQVASRKRGISGRFMSLSKRWTGFGSAKGAGAGPNGTGNSSGSNFNVQMGFYPPESPEAIMRQLADFGVFLRDWRLANSTYDLIRSDFGHDKAWAHHAAANEMAAITSLIMSSLQPKTRSDNIDQWLDAATYSYLTRCSSSPGAIRCLTMASELYGSQGLSAAGQAAKYAGRLLELGILGPIAQTLTSERMADYYMPETYDLAIHQPNRQRQAGLWNTLAALSWARLGRLSQAKSRIENASRLYKLDECGSALLPFASMHSLWSYLRSQVEYDFDYESGRSVSSACAVGKGQDNSVAVEEQLDTFVSRFTRPPLDSAGFSSGILETVLDSNSSSVAMPPLHSDGFE